MEEETMKQENKEASASASEKTEAAGEKAAAGQNASPESSRESKTSEEAAASEKETVPEEEKTPQDEKDTAGTDKKGFFKRKDKKDKKDEQIEELTDRVRRQMAEFENFRKRSEKEKSQMFDMGARNVIEKILPVVDNFERGLQGVPQEQKEEPFVAGMEMVYRQLMTELDKIGVKPIECVGKEFDPAFHNAVMQVENAEYESGTIAAELQKGYTYKDTVVRHSMVTVVQ